MNAYLVNFYNNVKDVSWPTIENFDDYYRLPLHIRQECEQQHNLTVRLNEIEDPEYWRKLTLPVWVKDNLGYVPILKCAHTYYSTQFQDLGWKQINIGQVDKNTVLFGLIKDPTTRWLKGVVEFLVNIIKEENITDEFLDNFFDFVAMPDFHSVCYHMLLGDYLHKINWIPMDLFDDQQLKTQIQTFCKKHGQTINFLDYSSGRLNQSTTSEKNLYNKIKKIHLDSIEKNRSYISNLQILLAPDLKFYRELVLNFDKEFPNTGNNTA